MNFPVSRCSSDILVQQNIFFKDNCSECVFQFLCFEDSKFPEYCLIDEALDYVFGKEVDKK